MPNSTGNFQLSMFIPLVSSRKRHTSTSLFRTLFPRKGGGGGGHGGGHASGKSASSSSSSKGSSSISDVSKSGGTFSASSTSHGGLTKSIIPAGQPFAGREVGGATRTDIYGTSTYGSGYPGYSSRGTNNRGFPFGFYPVVWPVGSGPNYLYDDDEYGTVDNKSRPGGPLVELTLSTTQSPDFTFRVITDNTTGLSLYDSLNSTCGQGNFYTLRITSPVALNASAGVYAQPEQAIQYYRASSIVLTMDQYNDTAIYDTTEPYEQPTALPTSLNMTELACINSTIGSSALLAGGSTIQPQSSLMLVTLVFGWLFLLF